MNNIFGKECGMNLFDRMEKNGFGVALLEFVVSFIVFFKKKASVSFF